MRSGFFNFFVTQDDVGDIWVKLALNSDFSPYNDVSKYESYGSSYRHWTPNPSFNPDFKFRESGYYYIRPLQDNNAEPLRLELQQGDELSPLVTHVLAWKSIKQASLRAPNLVSVPSYLISSIDNLSYMFATSSSFNQDISGWDTHNIKSMEGTFQGASSFNQDISGWDTSGVLYMGDMFNGASTFNQDLTGFIKTTSIPRMFANATNFNSPVVIPSNLPYTKPLGNDSLIEVFKNAQTFNQDLSSWENLLNINSRWDVGYDKFSMSGMFDGATSFNGDISTWGSKVDNRTNHPVLRFCGDFSYMFRNATSFNREISGWHVANSFDLSHMFDGATSFNQDLSSWNVSGNNGMTDFSYMFSNATSFNQDLSSWDTGNALTLSHMFDGATSFNSLPCPAINVSDVSHMFANATVFNQSVNNITLHETQNASYMFHNASTFNQDVSHFNLSYATDLSHMFDGASAFNQDLLSVYDFNYSPNNKWVVSDVDNFSYMFANATSFNGDISSWSVAGGSDFSYMFANATSFNGDISSWGFALYQPITMAHMFDGATSFNQDISGWDTSRVTDMSYMFRNATSFNGDISSWDINNVTDMTGLFDGVTLDTNTYNEILIAWANKPHPQNIVVSFGNSKYNTNGPSEDARNLLIADGWTIIDGGSAGDYDYKGDYWFSITTSDLIPSTNHHYEVYSNINNDWSENYDIEANTPTYVRSKFDITDARISAINSPSSPSSIISVNEWSDNMLTVSNLNGFNISTVPITLPASCTKLKSFFGRELISDQAMQIVAGWNTSQITDMSYLFNGTGSAYFTGNHGGPVIDNWDVSNVTNMYHMFRQAWWFQGDISSWDTSNVTNMNSMFSEAKRFNIDISGWDTSKVTDMNGMFARAEAFNQDLSGWNVSNIPTKPNAFDDNTPSWSLPKPVWGTTGSP